MMNAGCCAAVSNSGCAKAQTGQMGKSSETRRRETSDRNSRHGRRAHAEIWIAVAEKTGIPELRRTTRDEPDYDKLMRARLEILDRHNLKLSDIQSVISSLVLLPGAKDFLDELRTISQVIILSDTFEQFAQPLMRQLNWPTLLCHRLVVENDRIVNYQIRIQEQKQKAVAALKMMNYRVIAAGDSFNDTAMLGEADVGFLFHAPENVIQRFPQFAPIKSYKELMSVFKRELAS